MNSSKSVIITANSKNSVRVYRSELIKKLQELEIDVQVYSNISAIFWFLKKFKTKPIFISSDGRSNMIMLLFCYLNGVIILNGLGRYEKSRIIRVLMITLLRLRKNVICNVQSYRDYRYFSKYLAPNKVKWTPGSGGVARHTSKEKSQKRLLITRDGKFQPLKRKLIDKKHNLDIDIDIIGLSSVWRHGNIRSLGRVAQECLFSKHNKFLQLYYYGEGTPHSLVDAFASNIEIYIDRKSFRNFGMYKYISAEIGSNGLLFINPETDGYKSYQIMTSSKNILPIYIGDIISKLESSRNSRRENY